MMWLDRVAWGAILLWLEKYCRQNGTIQHCFIRHSTAWTPQNLWISDYDLAFFVEANSFSELRNRTIRIRRDLKKGVIFDAIVLPATPTAYSLCASHYAHRFLYPMNRWRCVYGAPIAIPDVASADLPLDHCPEGFLYGYVTPILQRRKRIHPAHRTLMKRKLEREVLQITNAVAQRVRTTGLYDVVAQDVRLCDEFYLKLSLLPNQEAVQVWPTKRRPYSAFVSRWNVADWSRSGLPGVESVWIYSSVSDDHKPYVVLNFDRMISRNNCKAAVDGLLKTFRGLEFNLLLGTERSMVGRLRGLSRVTLLEPWLCKSFGYCLYGDETTAAEISEPSIGEVKEKLKEYYLYLSYRVLPGTSHPYFLYRLCFTLDYLFRHRQLVVDSEDLADIYGREFLLQFQFEGSDSRQD